MSIDFFFMLRSKMAIIIRIGKNAPKPRPIFKASADVDSVANFIDIKLINQGPRVQPVSPESASTLYIEPPPFGNNLPAKLNVAGHIILTVNPVIAHAKRDKTGLFKKQVPI